MAVTITFWKASYELETIYKQKMRWYLFISMHNIFFREHNSFRLKFGVITFTPKKEKKKGMAISLFPWSKFEMKKRYHGSLGVEDNRFNISLLPLFEHTHI